MNAGLPGTEYAALLEATHQVTSPQTELDLLRIILNGMEDLSFNQLTCTEEEKVLLQQVEQTVTSCFRLMHREMQSLRADLARNQEQMQHLLTTLQSLLEPVKD